MIRWQFGYPEQALQLLGEALALARELSHPLTTVMCHYFVAWILYHRGDGEAAAETAGVVTGSAEFPTWVDSVAAILARVRASEAGGADRLDACCRQLGSGPSAGKNWRDALALALLADGYRVLGQAERGLQVLAPLAGSDAERFYGAEISRIRGELLLGRDAPDARAGEACFRQALAIARARQERSFELRAATSLGRLLQAEGRRGEARETLAAVYGWFTEGFDTQDLREARALLDTLA